MLFEFQLSSTVFGDDVPNKLMCGNYRPKKPILDKRQRKRRYVFKYTIPRATAFTTPAPNSALHRLFKTTQSNPGIKIAYQLPSNTEDTLPDGTSITESFREVFGPTERLTTFQWELLIDTPGAVENENILVDALPTTTTPTTTTTTTTTEDPLRVLMKLFRDLENDKR